MRFRTTIEIVPNYIKATTTVTKEGDGMSVIAEIDRKIKVGEEKIVAVRERHNRALAELVAGEHALTDLYRKRMEMRKGD